MWNYVPPAFTLLVSVAYFRAASPGTSTVKRLLVSAHGEVATLLFALAILMVASGNAQAKFGRPYLLLFILPFVLIGVALIFFRGNTKVHILQFPNVLAMLYIAFIGSMLISG